MTVISTTLYIVTFLAMATVALVVIRRHWSGAQLETSMRSEVAVAPVRHLPTDHSLAA